MSAARFIVSGKVQGVCFRAATREQAQRLGLRGSATNLPDGSVEVRVFGEHASVETLQQWLRSGPPSARVDSVYRRALDERDVTPRIGGFTIG